MNLREKFDEMKESFRFEASELLQRELSIIFTKYPKCESFTLIAFVDYFCDGDPCEFHYREYYSRINNRRFHPDVFPRNSSKIYFEDADDEAYYKENLWIRDAVSDFWELIHGIPSEVIQSIYGDHISVTFNRDGSTKVEEFTNHD